MDIAQLRQDYHHLFSIAVKWGEMDAFQHVNNTVFIRYLEDARIDFLTSLGMNGDLLNAGIGPIFASVTCNYLAPITFPDTVHVATKVTQTGSKKIAIDQVIYSEKLKKLAATATSLCVYYDYNNLKSCEVSPAMSDSIKRLTTQGQTL